MSDAHKNFAYSTVATAPSPATSGTSLDVQAGDGAKFPAVPFNAVIWPAGAQPSTTNAEIVRVTNISTDTLTITRTQESTSARTVITTDQIMAGITAKTLQDVETVANAAYTPGGTDVAVADGGTGSSTASGARTNLGLAIGTDVQAHDSDLDTIAGLTATTNNMLMSVSSAWASRTPAQVASVLAAEVGKLLFPVGSYYINETDSTNPATLLGFGTWSAVTDVFLVGHGSTYTSTGGSATHAHTLSSTGYAQMDRNGTNIAYNRQDGVSSWNANFQWTSGGAYGSTSNSHTSAVILGGGTDNTTNVPPYQAAYIWRRTA